MSELSQAEPPLSDPSYQQQVPHGQLDVFNTELLLASIHQTDDLVRNFQSKCDEHKRVHNDLETLNESAKSIRELYTREKEKCNQMLLEKQAIEAEYNELKSRLQTVEHEKVNNESLHRQTIAELEDTIDAARKESRNKCIELSDTIVGQGLILQSHDLSNTVLTRKCSLAREFLKANNKKFEWLDGSRSPEKASRSPSKASRAKKVSTACASTATDDLPIERLPPSPPKPVKTHDKGTMYIQSKATRSTCTSAFIRTTETSTNTDPNEDYDMQSVINAIMADLKPKPMLSPIRDFEEVAASAQSLLSESVTQTTPKEIRSQGTITQIQNVRKRLTMETTILDSPVKEEKLPPSFESMSNWFASKKLAAEGFHFANQQFLQIWTILGEMLFPMAAQQTQPISDQRLAERLRQIQTLIGPMPAPEFCSNSIAHKDVSLDGDKLDDQSVPAGILDQITESSMDSVESYHSDKFIISEVRNFSTMTESVPIPSHPPSKKTEVLRVANDAHEVPANPPVSAARKGTKRKPVSQAPKKSRVKKPKTASKVSILRSGFTRCSNRILNYLFPDCGGRRHRFFQHFRVVQGVKGHLAY